MIENNLIEFEKIYHSIANRYQIHISAFGGYIDFWLEGERDGINHLPVRIHLHDRNMAMLADALSELVDRHERSVGYKIDRMVNKDEDTDADNVVRLR